MSHVWSSRENYVLHRGPFLSHLRRVEIMDAVECDHCGRRWASFDLANWGMR